MSEDGSRWVYRTVTIPMKLTNNSDDTLTYVDFLRPPYYIYTSDGKNVVITGMPDFESGGVYYYKVAPHSEVLFDIRPRVSSNFTTQPTTRFKLAMLLLNARTANQKDYVKKGILELRNNPKYIIWSDEIEVTFIKP